MTRAAFVLGTAAVVVAVMAAAGARAQGPAFAAKPLLQSTVGGDDRKEAVVLSVTTPSFESRVVSRVVSPRETRGTPRTAPCTSSGTSASRPCGR